jgi:hypothetical protein
LCSFPPITVIHNYPQPKHAITTALPAHAVDLQDKSGPVENIPAAKRPLIVAEAGRASRGDSRARAFAINFLRAHCSRWLDQQCQTTRGSIRVVRVARILAVVLPHLQLPALFEKARERGHADKDARSVAGRPSLWKRAHRAISNGSNLHLKMHMLGKRLF